MLTSHIVCLIEGVEAVVYKQLCKLIRKDHFILRDTKEYDVTEIPLHKYTQLLPTI